MLAFRKRFQFSELFYPFINFFCDFGTNRDLHVRYRFHHSDKFIQGISALWSRHETYRFLVHQGSDRVYQMLLIRNAIQTICNQHDIVLLLRLIFSVPEQVFSKDFLFLPKICFNIIRQFYIESNSRITINRLFISICSNDFSDIFAEFF